ncbi:MULTISPECIES: ABC transporter permease [unclassified Streptomyces]|uniref:ABC transporter permease n=1 Tax=unclassified Streptomyces TaxID=2593676 RepID=UPI002DDAAF93|nr:MULTISPECIES: ABC transporter permease [unclassified Streptomyces]WSA92793.1 ABC transporter permease [Streptomyces sp. NBC_01795]WSB77163.1 ABC transporter permease [Streptomyces sp. NBC_01775]WSS14572.1 ABC transporter permease [Streptomyces sp. NBC_01186]WSS43387.1 ABC transporter permease [Streptomyces sp. NBC_01187]
MSTDTESATSPRDKSDAPGPARKGKLSYPVVLLLIAGGLLLLSLVRLVTGDEQLSNSDQFSSALGAAVPIGLAGLGGLWAERAGVINIGLEGMMMLGTFAAGWIGWQHGPWAAVLAGIAGGALGGLLHALATVTFGVDHIVSGVAINILALGLVRYLAKLWFGADGSEAAQSGGNDKQSPPMEDMPTFTVPGLADGLGSIEKHHWFLVSDLAGILRALVHEVSWVTLLTVVLFVASFFVLWRSSFGLRLRSCGENPTAAESLGVNVYKYKYAALTVSGALAGLGGAFLAIGVHIYQENQTGGRGYIGLATMIFGNWRPGGVAMGAGLFGFMDALRVVGGGTTVHAMLLLVAALLVALAVWKLRSGLRGARIQAAVSVMIAVVLVIWYALTDTVALEFVEMTPYVTTLLVLSLAAQRLRTPRAVGKTYRRGEGT